MCLHVRRLLCCPATITWPADLIFPPIQALGVPDVEGIVPRLKLAWVGPPSVKFGIHKSNVIFPGNWKGILKLHYSLVHVWCKEHFKSFVPWLVTLSWIWDTLVSRRSIWGETFIIKHESSILGLQVCHNVCSWIMRMMELWSGLEKPLENFIHFNQLHYLKNKIWTLSWDLYHQT